LLLYAHALVGKQDLPIPPWLFAWGASVVLIVSFVVLSSTWRSPRFEADSWRPIAPRLSGALASRQVDVLAGAVGVALLAVVVWSGLAGTEAPDRNFSITFVFVTFWLGLVAFSVLVGDLFRAFNPWRAIGRAAGAGFRAVAGQAPSPPLSYPERLGRWPAVAGVLGFLWLELVWGAGGFATVGLTPRTAAIAALVYSAITFVGMTLYGVEAWSRRGEAFSVYFRMLSMLSPLEMRDGRLGLRRPLSGAAEWASVPGSLALVLVVLGGTTFDGATEGPLQGSINSTFKRLLDLGLDNATALRIADSVFMALVLAGVAGIFLLGMRGLRSLPGSLPAERLRGAFAHTLIPIALAYLVAHYFSLVVFQEQAQFSYLLSDPLGDGSNLFGTASGGIDYGVIGATAVWYAQVAALVVGHVAALTLAHDRAIAVYRDPGLASRSQYWMLAMMVAFTCLGLFLLSQANA
jgi:hypothetical protein